MTDDAPRTLAELADLERVPLPRPGRRIQRSRLAGARTVQVLYREDAVVSATTGVAIGPWTPVRNRAAGDCAHIETMCPDCWRQWEQDHHLAVFEHGDANAYRNHGCRCTACSLAIAADHQARKNRTASADA
jgi:hypothetical protein